MLAFWHKMFIIKLKIFLCVISSVYRYSPGESGYQNLINFKTDMLTLKLTGF